VFLAAPHRAIGDKAGNVKAIEIVKTTLAAMTLPGGVSLCPPTKFAVTSAIP